MLGTTDTPRGELALEPLPLAAEIDFVLGESARCLARAPRREDVRSIWGGLRPLVRADDDEAATKTLSREHTVLVSPSCLVTVTGGKWTTYRAMAEDVLDICMTRAGLPTRPAGRTRDLPLRGAPTRRAATDRAATPAAPGTVAGAVSGAGVGADTETDTETETGGGPEAAWRERYGADADAVAALAGAGRWLAPGLSEAMVRYAVRHEYAREVEDVLARRHRLLFLDARAAAQAAPAVAAVMADELGPAFDADASVARFADVARGYLPAPPDADRAALPPATLAVDSRPADRVTPA